MKNFELIREITGWNGFVELYRYDDKYVVVSTVGDVAESFKKSGPVGMLYASFSNTFGGYALSGEETMAFECDENGKPFSYTELACYTGEGSREKVLDDFRNGRVYYPSDDDPESSDDEYR